MPRRAHLLLLVLASLMAAALTCSYATDPPTAPVLTTSTPVPLPPPPNQQTPATPTTGTLPLQSTAISADEMAQAIIDTDIPAFDAQDWRVRMRLLSTPVTPPSTAQTYALGDTETFFVERESTRNNMLQANLEYISEHAYFWVEDGVRLQPGEIERAADRFENEVYNPVRRVFGSEPLPGVDGDPRLHILHAHDLGADTIAFFLPSDRYPQAVVPDSNAREMFYVNLDSIDGIGDELYTRTLAHEFQHLIQSNVDPNESNWTDEGLAQVAERIAGFSDLDERLDFLAHTDTPLDMWPVEGDTFRNYGANYLFYLYVWEQLGEDAFSRMVQSPRNGLEAVSDALRETGSTRTVEQLFADWTVANLVDDPSIDGGRFGYQTSDTGDVQPIRRVEANPFNSAEQTPQYTATYYAIAGAQQLDLHFNGRPTAPLIPDSPHSGEAMWWASRGDNSDVRLTRKVDLSSVAQATLTFWTWFDLETDYDTAYVTVSPDGGQKWYPLEGQHTLDSSAEYFFPNYSGLSGGGSNAVWVQEQIDLTSYAGQVILLRFEVLTDTYYTRTGVALDDIAIPEIGFADDVESLAPDWQPEGWLRTGNVVPQYWGVYLVVHDASGTPNDVIEVPVAEDGSATWSGSLPDATGGATLVVAAAAPATIVPAEYTLELSGIYKVP